MTQSVFNRAHRLRLAAAASLALMVAAAAGCDGRPDPGASGPTSLAPPVTTTPAVPAAPGAPAAAVGPPTAAPIPTAPSSGAATTTQPGAGQSAGVHFTTPQAAMRYLTAAYNRNDTSALRKVTNPSARAALTAMRQEATNLQLTGCTRRAVGDYLCQFRHDYPQHLHRPGHGQATFLAAPAAKPGWYMTVLIDCG
jgi:predicted lipid-binding transport protein (Tim44 family)